MQDACAFDALMIINFLKMCLFCFLSYFVQYLIFYIDILKPMTIE